jgi:hypothetical protein
LLTAPGWTAEGESCPALAADSVEESCLSAARGSTQERDLALAVARGSAEETRPSTPSAMEKGWPPAPGLGGAESRQPAREAALLTIVLKSRYPTLMVTMYCPN